MPAVLDSPYPLLVELAGESQGIERALVAGGDRQLPARCSRCRVERDKRVRALVCVHPDHDHVHRPFVGCGRRSGPPADTPQLGRCHAPIKSRRRSSAAAGDTAKAGQANGRQAKSESARRRPRAKPTSRTTTDRRTISFSLRRLAGLAVGRRADPLSAARGAHDAGESRVAIPGAGSAGMLMRSSRCARGRQGL